MKTDPVMDHSRSYRASLTASARLRQTFLLVLIGLAIVTAYRQYRRQPHYQLRTFATSTGWGYTVLSNGIRLIDQPTVPGRAGTAGFSSRHQAEKVGERVIQKLRSEQPLPTLTPAELRRLEDPTQ